MAVLDQIGFSSGLHELCIFCHVALCTAAIELDSCDNELFQWVGLGLHALRAAVPRTVEIECVELPDISFVIYIQCLALAARAAVLVPPYFETLAVAILDEPRHVRELLTGQAGH